jgi:hypothetical protein
MTHSKGISWFDDCRIPHNEDLSIIREEKVLDTQNQGWGFKSVSRDNSGRFPANLLVCDDMLNDGIVYSSGSGDGKMEMININDAHHFNFIEKNRKVVKMKGVQYNDKGSNSRYYDIDKWFDNLIDV